MFHDKIITFVLFITSLEANNDVDDNKCNFPHIPKAGNFSITVYGQSSRILRYECDEGRHLLGLTEKNCLHKEEEEEEDVAFCAVDVLQGQSVVGVSLSSGMHPEKAFKGKGHKIHQG